MSTPLVVEEAAIATSAASSPEQGELIPPVPPPRRGILRKPKYSNTSSFTDDSAPTPTATATCALQSTITESKGDHHEVGETNNSLGALMADYGDSSSDDDDDQLMMIKQKLASFSLFVKRTFDLLPIGPVTF